MYRVDINHRKIVWGLVIVFSSLLFLNSSVYAEWTSITPPNVSTNWDLSGVHFISTSEGWAVGSDKSNRKGVLLHYLNGNWIDVTPPNVSTNWDLWGVYFTSSNEGWAVGSSGSYPNSRGVLLHYIDGVWTSITPPYVSEFWWLTGVHFTRANEGWAVGDDRNERGVLLHYSNGTWSSVTPPNVNSVWWWLSGVHFASPNEGWAVGLDFENFIGILLHYVEGTWSSVIPPEIKGEDWEDWGLTGVHFTSSSEGWAVETGFDGGGVIHYLNGEWASATLAEGIDVWNLRSVHFTSSNEGWVAGLDNTNDNTQGSLFHHFNGTWTSVIPPNVSARWVLNCVHFTSPDKGWAVGEDEQNQRGVLMSFTETVSTPNAPMGVVNGNINASYSYSTSGSYSDLNHSVEYQFDWKGNGSDLSNWGLGTQSKAWTTAGVYNVRARARCTRDTSIVSNWSDSLPVSISVPNISIAPTSNDFGNVKVKRSKTASFVVKNSGKANLSITSAITGTDASMFKITSGSGSKTIKPAKSLTVKVAFKPTSIGSKNANLEITSNDPVRPTIDIPLSGIGQ